MYRHYFFCRQKLANALLKDFRNITGSCSINVLKLAKDSPIKAQQSRLLHYSLQLMNQKTQYEYDPDTDSFRPKTRMTGTTQVNQNNAGHGSGDKTTDDPKINRRRRILLFLSGALFGGFLNSALYGSWDIRFEGAHSLILSGVWAPDIPEEHRLKYSKAIHYLIDRNCRDTKVRELLGKEVRLCGLRISEPLSRIHDSMRYGNFDDILEAKPEVKLECIMEGTLGVALVTIIFEQNFHEDSKIDIDDEGEIKIVLKEMTLAMLEPSVTPHYLDVPNIEEKLNSIEDRRKFKKK